MAKLTILPLLDFYFQFLISPMKHITIAIAFLFVFLSSVLAEGKIKVACIGNSVTFGAGIEDRTKTYPAQLQTMLGDNYVVRNFGKSGATLLKKGHNPYWEQSEFTEALTFKPDIVIIHLGLNDTDPRNWPRYRDEFTRDYISLIDTFKSVNPAVEVMICRMTPIFHTHSRFKSSTRDWFWQIQQAIETVAKTQNVKLIDLHAPLHRRPDLLPDALHPNAEGASIIAETVCKIISKNAGGLRLAPIFSDNMVLQRDKPVSFWGTANPGTKISVHFDGKTLSTTALYNETWEIVFPKKTADGKQHSITISNEHAEITLKNIVLGDVWLCSGQSNMEFELHQAATGKEDIPLSANTNIRFFDRKGRFGFPGSPYSQKQLTELNNLQFFEENTSWQESRPETSAQFSAVGYYFGKMLQDSLHVPIGLISNAVGGSPTEAWINRKTLEHHPRLVDMLYNWPKNDYIHPWMRERTAQNLETAENPLQRHPYHPAYLFESGTEDLTRFPITGVIWYQGESNAHNVELHEITFTTLVESWRKAWNNPTLPFYFVQLSSMETGRETWGHFRDSQRRLMSVIPHSGMAISSDVGNRTDVHPTDKKPVGERLARWALAKTYDFDITKSGPLFKNVTFAKGKAVVTFMDAAQLKTSDGEAVKSVELAGSDKVFYPASARIVGNTLEIKSDKVSHPAYVRYGWASFSEGNLINEAKLPASTFSSEF